MGISQNQGCFFGGPYNKDYSILGSILGFPLFRESSLYDRIGFVRQGMWVR